MQTDFESSVQKFEMTPNEVFANALLSTALACCVRTQTGLCTRAEAFSGLPETERESVWQALEALAEAGLVILKGEQIYLTNLTELFLAAFYDLSAMTIEKADQTQADNPGLAKMMKTINSDARLNPPEETRLEVIEDSNAPMNSQNRLKFYASCAGMAVIVIWGIFVMFKHQ